MFTKKYNGVNGNNRIRKSVKYIGKQKRVNRITKKKKTKKGVNSISGGNRVNRVNGLVRQYGGSSSLVSSKVSYCYMDSETVKTNITKTKPVRNDNTNFTLEIVYLYIDTDTSPKQDFSSLLKSCFNPNSTITKTDKEKFNDYVKYFFRTPKEQYKDKLESKDGLLDIDQNKIDGTNFTGIYDTGLSSYFLTNKDNILMDKYIIKYNGNINDKCINEELEKKNFRLTVNKFNDYTDLDNKVLGIKTIKDPDTTHIYDDYFNKLSCNSIKLKIDNRYVKVDFGYNNLGSSCYANSLIQLLKSIVDMPKYLQNYFNDLNIFPEKDKEELNTININFNNIKSKNKNKDINELFTIYNDTHPIGSIISYNLNLYKKIKYIEYILYHNNKIDNYYDPKYIKQFLTLFNFGDFQQDTTELFNLLNLDLLDEIINYYAEIIFSYKDKTFLFYKIVKHSNIMLNIEDKKKYESMQDIINMNFRREKMSISEYYDITDDNSKQYINFYKNNYYFVNKSNKYIFISLNLFIFGSLAKKISCTITDISNNICIKILPDDVPNDINNPKIKNKTDLKVNEYEIANYELISIIEHRGGMFNGKSSGHYVNYSKQINNNNKIVWVCYDDKDVKEINIKNLTQTESYTPYLFLYKQIEPDTPE